VCNSDSSSVAVVNTTTNLSMTAIVTGRGPIDISFIGREIFVLNNIDKSVSIINGDKNTVVLTPNLEKSI
jgi:DNA-binding beta-propeller fold protein YncE